MPYFGSMTYATNDEMRTSLDRIRTELESKALANQCTDASCVSDPVAQSITLSFTAPNEESARQVSELMHDWMITSMNFQSGQK
jgi:hypothetical protein